MSNCIFLFSICLLTILGGYTSWIYGKGFLNNALDKEMQEKETLKQYLMYLAKFNKKNYDKEEFSMRFEYFKKSLHEITRMNAIHPNNVFGLTKFSDVSEKEFRHTMLTPLINKCRQLSCDTCQSVRKCHGHHGRSLKRSKSFSKTANIPLRFDWRERGVVTDVLDQKLCHACWAMSIVGAMETMAAIHSGTLVRLSSQELLDCSTYNNQCAGGDIREALHFLCTNDLPIIREDYYPLKLVDQLCRIPQENHLKGIRIRNFTSTWVIAHHGPVVVAVNALPWYYYTSGVIQRACAHDWIYMNHVVQIVGYELTADPPYWIVRNSWGEDFGENGYLRLAMGNNTCGLTNNVAYFDVVYK